MPMKKVKEGDVSGRLREMAGRSRKRAPSEEVTPSWIWKIKEPPTPGRSGRKGPGKRKSKGRDPEAGPASEAGAARNGRRARGREEGRDGAGSES